MKNQMKNLRKIFLTPLLPTAVVKFKKNTSFNRAEWSVTLLEHQQFNFKLQLCQIGTNQITVPIFREWLGKLFIVLMTYCQPNNVNFVPWAL